MGTNGRREGGERDDEGASNVIEFPQNWIGPKDGLVPFGSAKARPRLRSVPASAPDVAAQRSVPTAGPPAEAPPPEPLSADSFWSGDETLQAAITPAAAAQPSRPAGADAAEEYVPFGGPVDPDAGPATEDRDAPSGQTARVRRRPILRRAGAPHLGGTGPVTRGRAAVTLVIACLIVAGATLLGGSPRAGSGIDASAANALRAASVTAAGREAADGAQTLSRKPGTRATSLDRGQSRGGRNHGGSGRDRAVAHAHAHTHASTPAASSASTPVTGEPVSDHITEPVSADAGASSPSEPTVGQSAGSTATRASAASSSDHSTSSSDQPAGPIVTKSNPLGGLGSCVKGCS